MMWNFLRPYWLSIAKWVGISATAALFLLRVRQSGRDAEKVKNLEQTIDAVKKSNEIHDNIVSLDDAARKRLRAKWQRD
jgi:uncharacterized membrane protein YdjX (TVP38/TMEM64 family)